MRRPVGDFRGVGDACCLFRCACLALACTASGGEAAAAEGDLQALVAARSIHCEFYSAEQPAHWPEVTSADPRAEVLVYYGGLNRERNRAITLSTRSAGAREAIVLRTTKAVHFVDYAAGIFAVTTVYGCSEREGNAKARRCTRYAAANSRHFDASVLWEPDIAFERYRPLASYGFCDHAFVASAPSLRAP